MKSQHWTQTTEGKARMSQIQQARIQKANETAATFAARTQIVLTIKGQDITLTADEAHDLVRVLNEQIGADGQHEPLQQRLG